jgi:predicted N-acetyltransferase YhbS
MIVLFGHPEYSPRSGFRPAREFAPPDGDAATVTH